MKIIDVNAAIGGKDVSGRPVGLSELLANMELYHITHAVCYHEYALLDPAHGNSLMKEIAGQSGGAVGVSALLDPALGADNLPGSGSLTRRLQAFAPESVRISPGNSRVAFHPFYWEEILEAVNELGLPIVIDGNYTSEFFENLPEAARQYPDAKFILVRWGTCGGRYVFPLIQKRKNVYFTVDYMVDYQQVEEICERSGAGQLLFGTSFPQFSPAGVLGTALYADIPETEREMILYKNWEVM